MGVRRVVVLGGYGNFGRRIAESLSHTAGVIIIVAGRNAEKAQRLCEKLKSESTDCSCEAAQLDLYADDFIDKLDRLSPDLVIHTGGPFQGQDYRVPKACISVGCHYIDLADDRRFVCDISSLSEKAMERNVLIVSGASSVPGLSSVVIDRFLDRFSSLEEIDFAIAPGNKADRGEATVKGILSYVGHPFPVIEEGRWTKKYGWMSPRKLYFGGSVGDRWLANVDIPDLELFPSRYSEVRTVNFQAGLELTFLHLGLVFMAWLAKIGLVKNWSPLSKQIFRSSEVFKHLGTDIGGMHIRLKGFDANQKPKALTWVLFAEDGIGPYIPTSSATIIAKKLIAGSLETVGAMPCMGMYTLEEFDAEASHLGIYHVTEDDFG